MTRARGKSATKTRTRPPVEPHAYTGDGIPDSASNNAHDRCIWCHLPEHRIDIHTAPQSAWDSRRLGEHESED